MRASSTPEVSVTDVCAVCSLFAEVDRFAVSFFHMFADLPGAASLSISEGMIVGRGRDHQGARIPIERVVALLKAATDGGDPPRVEAEPVHSAHVARVLDLEAAVHDHRHAAVYGARRRLLVDHS